MEIGYRPNFSFSTVARATENAAFHWVALFAIEKP
jgi:hypothetical protein